MNIIEFRLSGNMVRIYLLKKLPDTTINTVIVKYSPALEIIKLDR